MKTRIKELGARYDLTQEDLARKVRVRRETILFTEKGNYNPSLKLAHDIARALPATIDDLFIFEENARAQTKKLSKCYGRGGEIKAVDELDLEVYEGETFGLLGPNGVARCIKWLSESRKC